MSQLHIRIVAPHRLLQPYVYKMFVLEGCYDDAMDDDMKRITPNGTLKFVLNYKSEMRSAHDAMARRFGESSICIVGQMTKPTLVDQQGGFGLICIEFYPAGVYRLFDFPLHEITNCFYRGDELFGAWGALLQEQIAEAAEVERKIEIIEQSLLHRLFQSKRGDDAMDYAMRQIVSRHGLLRIEELSRDIGYSMRHFNRKFQAYAGLSPKELAGLYRFQRLYELGWKGTVSEELLEEYYYDQSHYFREFKKFTGATPRAYFRNQEQVSHIFYR